MPAPKAPAGLAARGRRLWREMHEHAEFNPAETVLLEEACRITDRLDRLDAVLTGREYLTVQTDESGQHTLVVDAALSESRQQANVLKQLIAALRLPDEATGKRPQHRGPRGSYQPRAVTAGVSSLERARARKTGA